VRFKNIIQNIGTNLLTTILGLVGSVILARWLGPSQRGIFTAIILIPNVLQYFINFGLSSATVYFTALPQSDKHKIWSSIFSIGTIQSILGILLGWIFIHFYLPKFSPNAVHLGYIYLFTIPMWLLGMYATYMLQGESYFKIVNILKSIIPTGYCVGIIMLRLLNILTVANMVYIQLCIQFIYLIISFLLLYKNVLKSFSFNIDLGYAKKIINYGLKVWIGDISQLANTRIDQFLIGFFLDSHDLGIYMVAFSVASFSNIFSNAFKTIIIPTIASETVFIKKVNETIFFFKSYWLPSLIFHIIFAFSVSILIPLVFGSEYEKSIFICQILIVGFVFINAKSLLSGAMQGMEFPEIVSIVEVIGMIVSLIFCFFLIKNNGLTGVSFGLSLSYFSQFFVLIIYIHKKRIISYKSLLSISLSEFNVYFHRFIKKYHQNFKL
jgi:O-antigen/teichoic acid export membrane protein